MNKRLSNLDLQAVYFSEDSISKEILQTIEKTKSIPIFADSKLNRRKLGYFEEGFIKDWEKFIPEV